MGTFAGYSGKKDIAEKELFAERMGKVLNLGGMMQFEEVKLFGHKLGLLKPVEVCLDSEVEFHYNYFEDDAWEPAYFDAADSGFSTSKTGNCEFLLVVLAAYMLYELHDTAPGLTDVDGDVVDSSRIIGWLNQILGTQYSMGCRFPLWEKAEAYALENLEYYDTPLAQDKLMYIIPQGLLLASGSTDLTDLLYIVNGTETLKDSEVCSGTYPYDVLKCRTVVREFIDKTGQEDSLQKLWELVCTDWQDRQKLCQEEIGAVAQMSLILPARVIVYLAAEYRDLQFWEVWKDLKDRVYHDEQGKEYASEELRKTRHQMLSAPVLPVRTSDYLKQDGYFTFYDTPEELKDRPNYYLSDDDRLYWWQEGSDEVRISGEMDIWLQGLAKRYTDILTAMDDHYDDNRFLKKFLGLMSETEQYYKRIYPFQSMFYEFIQNGGKKEYRAAVELFRELAEENREEGAVIKYARSWKWDMVSKNVTSNIARLRLKRYLSVMANCRLRKKYFGF